MLAVLLACAALGAVAAQAQPTETGFVQVEEDVRLFYQRFGTGTPTLFVPNRHELMHTFAPLFERVGAVAWDPRGRGLSSRPADMSRYGPAVEMADAEALRRHFGADPSVYLDVSPLGRAVLRDAALIAVPPVGGAVLMP
jgi:pimeloyl-ACP methyl ester carboxylesterase